MSNRTFGLHQGVKISVTPSFPRRTRDDLSMAYITGVGRISRAIVEDSERVWELTIKHNSMAVLTDGTAITWPRRTRARRCAPLMEGKAMLLKELANIDAYPVCVGRGRSTSPRGKASSPDRANQILSQPKHWYTRQLMSPCRGRPAGPAEAHRRRRCQISWTG